MTREPPRPAWWRWPLVPIGLLAVGPLLVGCTAAEGTQPATDPDGARVTVVATMSIVGDLAAQVGGADVDVEVIVPVGADPHTFEPRPEDARRLEEADLIVSNGAGLEERWLDDMIARSDAVHVALADGLEPRVLEEGEDAGEPDPHMWNDPVLVRDAYLPRLLGALVDVHPEAAADLRARAEECTAELDALDGWIRAAVATVPAGDAKLVTTHDAFAYFGERYGLTVVGTLYGVSTEIEPSAAEVTELVDAIRDEAVPAVFVETLTSPELMQRVAREADVTLGDDLLGDSVGAQDGTDTYAGMIRANVRAIVEGLGGEVPR